MPWTSLLQLLRWLLRLLQRLSFTRLAPASRPSVLDAAMAAVVGFRSFYLPWRALFTAEAV